MKNKMDEKLKALRGKFITFEGGEGSGKTTQSKRLHAKLIQQGVDAIWTREPGGSDGAEAIRALLVNGASDRWSPETEALLMFAARNDHFHKTIAPVLERGGLVICDRFADSSLAYQGYGKGVSLDFLNTLYANTIQNRFPDRTYLLDISAEKGLGRAAMRAAALRGGPVDQVDRFEALGLDFHERVHSGFRTIAAANEHRFCVVDATLSEDKIETQIWTDFIQGFHV
jgi:dTMP kinase